MQVQCLGQEDSLEEERAIHSTILAWKIPWTEEPGGLQFIGSQKSQDLATKQHQQPFSLNLRMTCLPLFTTVRRCLFPACRKESDTTEQLNWTELIAWGCCRQAANMSEGIWLPFLLQDLISTLSSRTCPPLPLLYISKYLLSNLDLEMYLSINCLS